MIISDVIYQKAVLGLFEKDVPSSPFTGLVCNVFQTLFVFGEISRSRVMGNNVNILLNEVLYCGHIIQCRFQKAKIILFKQNFNQLIKKLRN